MLLLRSNPCLLSSCPFVHRLSPWLVLQWRIIIKCVRGSWGQWEGLRNWELSPHQLQRDGKEKHYAHWTFATNFFATLPKTKCKDFIILLQKFIYHTTCLLMVWGDKCHVQGRCRIWIWDLDDCAVIWGWMGFICINVSLFLLPSSLRKWEVDRLWPRA